MLSNTLFRELATGQITTHSGKSGKWSLVSFAIKIRVSRFYRLFSKSLTSRQLWLNVKTPPTQLLLMFLQRNIIILQVPLIWRGQLITWTMLVIWRASLKWISMNSKIRYFFGTRLMLTRLIRYSWRSKTITGFWVDLVYQTESFSWYDGGKDSDNRENDSFRGLFRIISTHLIDVLTTRSHVKFHLISYHPSTCIHFIVSLCLYVSQAIWVQLYTNYCMSINRYII